MRYANNANVALQFGHACLRVETARRKMRKIKNMPLQFGHACLRVETTGLNGAPKMQPLASIRPRLLARGDGNTRVSARPTHNMLQFGHACLRVETLSNASSGNGRTRFNSATPACAWRQSLSTCLARAAASSFNSATPACAWRRGLSADFGS